VNIIELNIPFEFNGQSDVIHPSLIVAEQALALVDAGYPGFLPRIEREIARHGYDVADLTHIIVTHYDIDHIGALHDFKAKYPHIRIVASEREAGAIEGRRKAERLIQAENMQEHLPDEQREFGLWFIRQLQSLKHVPVDETVRDGDSLFDGRCRVIATPGHTPGHISLYIPELDSVITGDAAVNENGRLAVANPQLCLDLAGAERSLEALADLRAARYYCYHGGKLDMRNR
jgi:glyoxylase-like metal-dependent hydrolase (beta-lactamase superfamily II)